MKHRIGYNPDDGADISCTIDSEQSEAVVTYGERLRFLLNPDFPQDAQALFEALCNVKAVVIDQCDDRSQKGEHIHGKTQSCSRCFLCGG